jgi:hypothetical protein
MGMLCLTVFMTNVKPPQTTIRMRLLQTGVGTKALAPASSAWWSGVSAKSNHETEPPVPLWKGSDTQPSQEMTKPAVPVTLDELLGVVDSSMVTKPVSSGGWTSAEGEGYSPPPLPPPGLAPPEGSRWNLVLTIPAGGGFAIGVEGLNSGHPELDRWLEEYLRTVAFPSSPDSAVYRVRWSLQLDSGRPR